MERRSVLAQTAELLPDCHLKAYSVIFKFSDP